MIGPVWFPVKRYDKIPAMLIQIQVQNFALAGKASLEFSPHLNVLTGETGAGKSILIDAIRFVLGERVDVRPAPGQNASAEAVFELHDKKLRAHEALEPFKNEDDEDVLILRKETNSEGKSKVWINGRAATTAALRQIGSLLIDIHGQYDHQQLLDAANHLDLVDRFAKIENTKKEYEIVFAEYHGYVQRREELARLAEGRERELDLLKYQVEEIERAKLVEGEEDELKAEQSRYANSEKLYEACTRVLDFLESEERSVSDLLGHAYRDVTYLAKIDSTMEEAKGEFENVQLGFEEMSRKFRDYRETLSFDPERLAEIDKRLDIIDLLKRKYGGSILKVLEFFETSKKRYDELVNKDVYEKEIGQNIKKILPRLEKLASELTLARKKAGALLKKTIETELGDLQIPYAKFECKITQKDYSAAGQDEVEFMISLNAGEEVLSLAKIISGGEVSRVMLALKKALIKVDPVGTLIFDEIDANIGGRLGEVTGQKLKEISRERQVLLVTHLPQIASFADKHFKVTKKVQAGKTSTEYLVLEGKDRVSELSQMMSGKQESAISKKHAEEMLSRAR